MNFCFAAAKVNAQTKKTSVFKKNLKDLSVTLVIDIKKVSFQFNQKGVHLPLINPFEMNQLLKTVVVFPIRLYKIFLSPLLGPSKCRYSPTCSQYMIDAILEWGILRGLFMGVKRIGRCHPWAHHDHFDPVPKRK
jgi:uncharacterized protein